MTAPLAPEIRPIRHYASVLPEPQALLPEQRPFGCEVSLAKELTQRHHRDVRLLLPTEEFLVRLPGRQPPGDWSQGLPVEVKQDQN